ncbi:MAG: hypothetical protein RIB98_14940 [Acidimicrobiales bacterium]
MAITFDITPIGPGESPEAAMARIYGGGLQISWTETDDGWETVDEHIEDSVSEWEPPSGWAKPVIERLLELYPYQREDDEGGGICLWDTPVTWQVEFFRGGVTLRRRPRASNEPPAPTDAELLGAFAGIHAVVHFNGDEWWAIVEEAANDDSLCLLDLPPGS